MLNQNRESSHSLSKEEKNLSMFLARSIEPILTDESRKAHSQYPDFFTSIVDSTQMLSVDISEILFELLRALKLSFNVPLTIQFGIIDSDTNAFVEFYEDGKARLVISLAFLEYVAKETGKGNGFEAHAQLRYVLAHEFFHLYSKVKYPTTTKRSSEVNKQIRTNKSAYDLDLGERSANLFAIKHLLDQSEKNKDQKSANIKVAQQEKSELRNKLVVARIQRKIKSLFIH